MDRVATILDGLPALNAACSACVCQPGAGSFFGVATAPHGSTPQRSEFIAEAGRADYI